MKTIYLDHAAATPVDPSVLEAMVPYFSNKFYNPSAIYGPARQVAHDLAEARSTVAQTIGARPIEINFTAGGSEANNLAITGVLAAYPGSRILVSSIEHESVLEAAKPHSHGLIPVTEQGLLDVAAAEKAITEDTVLLSVMYANNEIGTVQPVKELAALVGRVRAARRGSGNKLPLYLHTDASQAANYLDVHVARLGVDLMTLNGGKIYGPKQSGALYVRSGTNIEPLIRGGGQEHGLRSGTENVAAAAGFARALQIAQSGRHDEARRLAGIQAQCMRRLADALPAAVINGSLKKRLPNNIHLSIPGVDNERLIYMLEDRGILAAAGSACSASDEAASHVLLACGITEAAARSSLRLTMGRDTTQEDMEHVVAVIAELA